MEVLRAEEDRELVSLRQLCVTCGDQRGDDVIQGTTKIVHEVPDCYCAGDFFNYVEAKVNGHLPCLWVDMTNADGDRVVLPQFGGLRLQRVKVNHGPVNLGGTSTKVKVEAHVLRSAHEQT